MNKKLHRADKIKVNLFGRLKRWVTSTILAMLAISVTGLTAIASEIGVLRIQNNSNATQTFIVIDDYHECMDFPVPRKDGGARTNIVVAAGSHTDTQFAKDGRCEGEQGRFLIMALDRSTGQPFGNSIAFWTDTGANLERIWDDQAPTPHAVGLNPIGVDYVSGNKTFVLNTNLPGYDVQTPTGKWVFGCGGGQQCTKELTSSVSNTVSREETTSKEIMSAFSATVSAGFEFEGISGGAEFTSSSSETTAEALSLASSGTMDAGDRCETATDLTAYQIYSVWQWSIEAYVGTDKITTTTCQVTCTQTGAAPTYLPGSPEAINACLKPRSASSEQAATQLAVAEQEAVRNRPATCVTLYKGYDGAGEKLTLCGADQDNWNGQSISYINLGSSGAKQHSHHYGVQSWQCGSGRSSLTFTNGNANPATTQNASCGNGGIVNDTGWVKANATGVGIAIN